MVAVSGADSRPSKTNRQGHSELPKPRELCGPSLRPLSVEEGVSLRDEARCIKVAGDLIPIPDVNWDNYTEKPEIQARTHHKVLNEWRDWIRDYQSSHIEFENPDGETVRGQLQNSYMESYADRYYAKLKDFERAVERSYADLTTVMLTFTASHRNAREEWRCPADHMRDVINGWNTARKQLYHVLSDFEWEYARILEPHQDGYGHLHVGIAVDTDGLTAELFRPVMESYVSAVKSAGSEAHGLNQTGLGSAVSVNDDIEHVGNYLAEYIGIYGDSDSVLDRPIHEQMFYAVCWATNTRRVNFSNGAQQLIADEKFRRETGLRPEDRGDCEAAETDAEGESTEADGEAEDSGWTAERICTVDSYEPHYYPPESSKTGGPIDGIPDEDPAKYVG